MAKPRSVCKSSYNSLISYFRSTEERQATVRRITTGLENPLSKLYLMFLSDALSLINTFNKTMQMHSPTVHVLYQEVLSFVKKLLLRFLSPASAQGARISALDLHDTSQFLSLDKVFIGEKTKKIFHW